MATSTSRNPVPHHPQHTARRSPSPPAIDVGARCGTQQASVGRSHHRAVVPSCWIVRPLFVGVEVMLVLVVMTDLAIMVMALA